MEQATPPDSSQPTVQQMFATLLGEIATLRRQNEDQQRQLEHLRGATSLLLERDNSSLQTLRKPQFRHLPVEIRKMIWDFATPRRLLGRQGIISETGVPSALSIPAVAQVCRESRRIAMSQNEPSSGFGKSNIWGEPTTMWRLKYKQMARWTWFTPHKDALLIDPKDRCAYPDNWVLAEVAEHVIVEDASPHACWGTFKYGNGCIRYPSQAEWGAYLDQLTSWVHSVAPWPDFSRTTDPDWNLRTVDFLMTSVTKIDRNYPPNFVRRLFAGDDVRVVDLRDEEAAYAIDKMMRFEVDRVMDSAERFRHAPTELEYSLHTYQAVADELFPQVVSRLLERIAKCHHNAYLQRKRDRLPSTFKDSELNMQVTWVKELYKRIDVRPVHVFVRAEGISKEGW